MGTPDVAAAADRLYALAPPDFISARNDETARAKAAGDTELAAALKRLPKPSSSAWLVNALARQPGRLDPLFELGSALQAAQQDGDGDQLRQLSRQRHRAIRDLLAEAAVIAEDAGGWLADIVARGVAATLEAAVVDPDAAQAVQSGLLVRALNSTGFEPVDLTDAVAVVDAMSSRGAGSGPLSKPSMIARGRRGSLHAVAPLPEDKPGRVGAAQRALTEAGENAANAERALIVADSALDSIADTLERARTRVAETERAVLEARAEVATLEKDRIQAGRDRDAAARRRDSARRLLAQAQAMVDRRG